MNNHSRSLAGPLQQHIRLFSLTIGAALLYGSVGAWMNHAHGGAAMLSAALIQGSASALTTLLLSGLIDRVLGRLNVQAPGRMAKTIGLSVLVASLGAIFHLGVNIWAGTPEWAATAAAPILALFVYCPLYAVTGARKQGLQVSANQSG